MNEVLKDIDKLNVAIDKLDEGKIEYAKDELITLRDEKQKVVDDFEKTIRNSLANEVEKFPMGELANDPIKEEDKFDPNGLPKDFTDKYKEDQ